MHLCSSVKHCFDIFFLFQKLDAALPGVTHDRAAFDSSLIFNPSDYLNTESITEESLMTTTDRKHAHDDPTNVHNSSNSCKLKCHEEVEEENIALDNEELNFS